ncbi:N-acyl-L-homoserine lactone synthetase [Rhizobium sp. Root73]|uniref:acyl-homoserine-lactone synthase n=1 Tax=unclassified Rhizobium TaxID=2613769 RepID=UPI000729443D|nr:MULTISPECIES: acyl-homoserine-lactone synthase [unclassified Rhizobium]KQY15075.1 N-acyl-L-homoserine lactone synthetase [Rhizobium sp. Root1334]KRC06596.1 N-acyl-L-homoserine lactone synthetase [Rhizobium sp. Root73]
MLRILYEHEDREFMERVWSFRYVRFVEQLGWANLRRPDCRERDRFDHDHALHVALLLHDEIIGYSRLLPTTISYLSAEVSGAKVNLPSGPEIFEWTRCATALDAPCVAGVAASDILMTGVLECLLHLGAKRILFLTHPSLIQMMRRRGYPVEILATLAADHSGPVQIASAEVCFKLLCLQRKAYGINGSLVSWGNVGNSFLNLCPKAA